MKATNIAKLALFIGMTTGIGMAHAAPGSAIIDFVGFVSGSSDGGDVEITNLRSGTLKASAGDQAFITSNPGSMTVKNTHGTHPKVEIALVDTKFAIDGVATNTSGDAGLVDGQDVTSGSTKIDLAKYHSKVVDVIYEADSDTSFAAGNRISATVQLELAAVVS